MMSLRRFLARIAKGAGLAATALVIAGIGVCGALLLEYAGPSNVLPRRALVVGFALAAVGTLIALFVRRWRWRAIGTYGVLCAGLAILWSSIEPTNERDWQPEVAVLPYATIEGDRVTVHNIRNFDYRSETDYTPAYYDKTFDLQELRSLDLVTSYWAGPAIAHVFVSFGFAGDDYLAISIEVRKPKGEGYSTLKGFFRQYELVYVAADERDIIRLRTNYRRDPPEDVYIYRVKSSIEAERRLFLRVHAQDECAQDAARVLQHANDQLHDQHLDEHPRQFRTCAVELEDPGERLCARVSLRTGSAGDDGLVISGIAAAGPCQCARPDR